MFSSCGMLRVKTWLTNITVCCFFLSGGIEYSVILPTCWDYMHDQFGAEKWLYGLAIAALSISNLLIGPIMGAIYDRTGQTKLIVLFLNLFEIGGNFMYFAATSKYMVLGSRFIVGIGVSAGAVLFGEISRTSLKKRRTITFSFFMSARQLGLVLGPGLNLFLRKCNFHIGPFMVDKYTSPALLMMGVWIILEVMFLCMFFQLPTASEQDISHDGERKEKEANEPLLSQRKEDELAQDTIDDTTVQRYGAINSPPLLPNNNTTSKTSLTKYKTTPTNYKTTPTSYKTLPTSYTGLQSYLNKKWTHLKWILGEFVTEQITFLLAVLFITMFNQLVLETGLVPLVEVFFGWNELDISWFYSGAGALLLVSFFIVAVCTKFLSDRWLIAFGVVATLFSFIWDVVILGSGKKYSYSLAAFLIGAGINVFTIPFVFVTAASLYSKYLPQKIQGFGQGVRRSVGSLAAIMGPLWAGSGFELAPYAQYYPLFGVLVFLSVLMLILFVISFRNLNYQVVKNQLQEDNKTMA